MKRFITLGLASLAIVLMLAPIPAYAEDVFDNACDQPGTEGSPACQSKQDSITGSDGIISDVTNVVSLVGGIIAVIVIIIAGFMYVTAGGDSGKLKSARNAIIYAVVGLAVIALAQAIVVFVINRL